MIEFVLDLTLFFCRLGGVLWGSSRVVHLCHGDAIPAQMSEAIMVVAAAVRSVAVAAVPTAGAVARTVEAVARTVEAVHRRAAPRLAARK